MTEPFRPESSTFNIADIIDAGRSLPPDYESLIGNAAQYNADPQKDMNLGASHIYFWNEFVEKSSHYASWDGLTGREARRKRGKVRFATKFEEMPEDIKNKRRFLRDKLKSKILVDLGGGVNMSSYYDHDRPELGSAWGFALEMGMAAYVNVDKYQVEEDHSGKILKQGSNSVKTVCFAEREDSLRFATRLKDGTCNFMINKIDEYIVPDDYKAALLKEVIRACIPGGLIMGDNEIYGEIRKLNDPRVEVVPLFDTPRESIAVFQKV